MKRVRFWVGLLAVLLGTFSASARVELQDLYRYSTRIDRVESDFFLGLKFTNGDTVHRDVENQLSDLVAEADRLERNLSPRQRKAMQKTISSNARRLKFLYGGIKQNQAARFKFAFRSTGFWEYVKKVHRPENRVRSTEHVGLEDVNPDRYDAWLSSRMSSNIQRVRSSTAKNDSRQSRNVRDCAADFYLCIRDMRSALVRIAQAEFQKKQKASELSDSREKPGNRNK